MSKASINRSLATVRTELEFLQDSDVITPKLYEFILKKLPQHYTDGMSPYDLESENSINQGNVSEKLSSLSVDDEKQDHSSLPPPPAYPPQQQQQQHSQVLGYAEALYDFQKQEPTDLELHKGDKITIYEKPSADWWKGTIGNASGMFPSNYVRVFDGNPQTYPYEKQSYNNSNTSQPQYPPPQGSPSGYYPPPQPIVQQPPQQQPVVVQQQAQQSQSNHSGFKRFGKQLKDAAVFGAGATIGSDIVNSIL
ncbi:hypothetical protein PACTADRAFT_47513 [Pachysolen tannophilus NRRL Y-2460]|uniref:SH3 domain-containing protein n=1 Tax=Pachysolen tannophilus NRRL Y-2460 TaxID=669874 RepID=A0A1E4U0X3_PACTA|nr:hypothetical protein PACTADRAFT_47513 [Pachysolen tannophilus NRRL Y-2460]